MGRMYFSAVDFIKHREFDVWVPMFYSPHLTEEEKNPKLKPRERTNQFNMVSIKRKDPTPFRQVIDPAQMQKACFSIEIMLDMFQKQIEFELADETDVVEIFDGLDRYLLSLKGDVASGIDSVISYVKLVIRWRAEVYKHYFRFMANNPTAKESLYPNNSPTQNLLHLMMMSGGNKAEVMNLDPLRARAKPPYEVGDLSPKEASPKVALDDEMGSSLGLSPVMSFLDDGKDFNLDDFIGRG